MPTKTSPLRDAVIAFDLDGTLVESAPDLMGTLSVLLAQECFAPLLLAEGRHLIGHGAGWLIERGFAGAGAPLMAN